MAHRRARRAARAIGAVSLAWALVAAGGDPSQPGAYCPLPKAGEKPSCLAGPQQAYEGFFLGVEGGGDLDDEAVAQVEEAVRQGEVDALSSLSYGYFMLARAQAASETPDAGRIARLERWNQLLADAYADTEDPRFRLSVREAAVDINQNVPALGLRCRDEQGNETRCNSTEAVIRAIDLARQQTGLRGALARLLGSLFGGGDEAP